MSRPGWGCVVGGPGSCFCAPAWVWIFEDRGWPHRSVHELELHECETIDNGLGIKIQACLHPAYNNDASCSWALLPALCTLCL